MVIQKVAQLAGILLRNDDFPTLLIWTFRSITERFTVLSDDLEVAGWIFRYVAILKLNNWIHNFRGVWCFGWIKDELLFRKIR